jgi:hypothetical protein
MKAPVPTEQADQIAFAKLVRQLIHPMWRFTHIASGEKRDPKTAALLKAMGVERGWPDFIFIGPPHPELIPRGIFLLELKRRQGGRETIEQQTLRLHLMSLGFRFHVTNDTVDALDELYAAGITRAQVSA